jgi:type I restriction enzyme S subunit
MSEVIETGVIPTGFRQTQLGPRTITVPGHWSRLRIKDVSDVVTRGKQPTYVEEPGIPILNQSCIYWDGYHQESLKYLDEDVAEDWKTNHFAAKGDILINSTGQGTLGRALCWDNESGTHAIDSHITRVSVDSDTIDPEFLRYYLESSWGQTMLYVFCVAGSTGQIELSKTDLMSMPLLSPPVGEQRRIAEILSTVDELIQQTDAIIEETERLKRGLMQDLLIRGIGHYDYEKKYLGPRRIEIPRNWQKYRLEEVSEIITRGKQPTYVGEGGVPVLNQSCIYWDKFHPEAIKRLDSQVAEDWKDKYWIKEGDVLINSTGKGTLGRALEWTKESNTHVLDSHITRIHPDKSVLNPTYFRFYLESNHGQKMLYAFCVAGSTGQIELSKTDLQTMPVLIPPAEEQREISKIFQRVNEKLQEEQETKEKLQDLKRGLMQDLLTGKVRVPVET